MRGLRAARWLLQGQFSWALDSRHPIGLTISACYTGPPSHLILAPCMNGSYQAAACTTRCQVLRAVLGERGKGPSPVQRDGLHQNEGRQHSSSDVKLAS
jgi:hypothetical protein